MVVEMRINGRRYVEDRTTTIVLSGNRSIESSFRLRWRMELTDDAGHPWRIATVLEPGSTNDDPGHIQAVEQR